DLPDKVFGQPRFIHDLELPGMLHGGVLRPPSPVAALEHLDEMRTRALAEVVEIVRDGSFVGVIARSERAARAARAALAAGAVWREEATLPDENDVTAWLKAQPAETVTVATRGEGAPRSIARTLRATYTRPFVAHASLAPSCAIARFDGGTLSVWSHTQGIYN